MDRFQLEVTKRQTTLAIPENYKTKHHSLIGIFPQEFQSHEKKAQGKCLHNSSNSHNQSMTEDNGETRG